MFRNIRSDFLLFKHFAALLQIVDIDSQCYSTEHQSHQQDDKNRDHVVEDHRAQKLTYDGCYRQDNLILPEFVAFYDQFLLTLFGQKVIGRLNDTAEPKQSHDTSNQPKSDRKQAFSRWNDSNHKTDC